MQLNVEVVERPKKRLRTVSSSKECEFEDMCNVLLADGYELVSSSSHIVQSELYDFCDHWMAIFILKV